MVLRCPNCSELKFFGRTQLLGDLVVCPQCAAVFGWSEAGGNPSAASSAGPVNEDKNGTNSKP